MKKETQLKVLESKTAKLEETFTKDKMLEKLDTYLIEYKRNRSRGKEIGEYITALEKRGYTTFEIKLLMEKRADIVGYTPDEKKDFLGIVRKQLAVNVSVQKPVSKVLGKVSGKVNKTDEISEESADHPQGTVQIMTVECDKKEIPVKDILEIINSKHDKFYIDIQLPDKTVLGFKLKK